MHVKVIERVVVSTASNNQHQLFLKRNSQDRCTASFHHDRVLSLHSVVLIDRHWKCTLTQPSEPALDYTTRFTWRSATVTSARSLLACASLMLNVKGNTAGNTKIEAFECQYNHQH